MRILIAALRLAALCLAIAGCAENAQTYGQAPSAGAAMTTSQCDAEYAANKATIKTSGQTKRAFVAACPGATPRCRKAQQARRRLHRSRHLHRLPHGGRRVRCFGPSSGSHRNMPAGVARNGRG